MGFWEKQLNKAKEGIKKSWNENADMRKEIREKAMKFKTEEAIRFEKQKARIDREAKLKQYKDKKSAFKSGFAGRGTGVGALRKGSLTKVMKNEKY